MFLLFLLTALNLVSGYCPRGCSCDNEELWVKCTRFSLNMVPITLNPHITSFRMQYSNITTLHEGFQFYEDLLDLDFSHNGILFISDAVFAKQGKLRLLNLSHNELRSLGALSLAGLESLEELQLQHNLLEVLQPGWIQHSPRLSRLILCRNNLKTLEDGVFVGGHGLTSLDIGGNLFSQVPDLSLAGRLETLSLASNRLVSFSFCALASLHRLVSLNISSSGLSGLTPCSQVLRSVESLDISGNYLSLPAAELLALPNLRSLRVGQKNISVLTKSSFAGLDNLRSIEVANCPELISVQPGLFAGLSHLENITLRSNPKLDYLPVGLVLAGEGMLRVSLPDNGITWIDPGSLPWSRVSLLDLSNNPLQCDCRMASMISALERVEDHTAVCLSPPEFFNLNVSELDRSRFRCVLLDPVQVSVLSLGFILFSLISSIIGFIVYRHRKSSAVISDVPGAGYPGYLEHYKGTCKLGWPEKRNQSEGEWDYLEPKCSCREMLELPSIKTCAQDRFRQKESVKLPNTLGHLDISSTFRRSNCNNLKWGLQRGENGNICDSEDWGESIPGLNRCSTTIATLLERSNYFLPQPNEGNLSGVDKFSISDIQRREDTHLSRFNIENFDLRAGVFREPKNGPPTLNGLVHRERFSNDYSALDYRGGATMRLEHTKPLSVNGSRNMSNFYHSQEILDRGPELRRFNQTLMSGFRSNFTDGIPPPPPSTDILSVGFGETSEPSLRQSLLRPDTSLELSQTNQNSRHNLVLGHLHNQSVNSSNLLKSTS